MKMILKKAFIGIYFLAFVSAFPHPPKHHQVGAEKRSKQNQEDDQENNLPLVFSDYYNYYNYDYYNYLDCNGDICIDGQEWFDVEKNVELDNSNLEVIEDAYFYVNTSSLWEECAPSVPSQGRLARFKSCQKWTEDYDNIFNSWYINDVCNYKKRMWLGQDGEIDEAKVGDMFKELEGFGEYLNSCIQWDGEWPDYYGYDYYDYDYDYRVEKGNEKKGTKGKDNTGKSTKKQSKTKTKKRSGNKNKNGHKVGYKNKNKARKKGKNHSKKGKRNKIKKKKKNKNTNKKQRKKRNKSKKKKQIAKRKNKGKRNQYKKANKNNKKVNGMRYKREAAKDKKEKKKDKKKKKQKKQKKALKVIELSTLPTEQTIERLRCIEVSVFKKLDECGENILKNGLS